MLEIIEREFIYISYYFMVQLRQIFVYWVAGMVIGSFISVFAQNAIHSLFGGLKDKKMGIWGVIPASLLGTLSPLCMYGTIPIAASFSRQGMRDDWLAAFMMSSILLNPQLMLYSTALGGQALAVRLITCILCGVLAGLLVHFLWGKKEFFRFDGFEPGPGRDTDPNLFLRFLKNLGRNVRATGPYFLIGVLLSALFQRYVPADAFASLFGENEGFGLLLAATIGVPLYACGGGTIPLLQQWLASGMSMGAAASFMITGPATKITNLGALKIVLGIRHFLIYLIYVMGFSMAAGLMVNLIL
ncbi:MAG: permease [Clostridiales bacterium]|nr:permease [Clostridiales bacterium]